MFSRRRATPLVLEGEWRVFWTSVRGGGVRSFKSLYIKYESQNVFCVVANRLPPYAKLCSARQHELL